ncbi:LCP family protein [Frondihabitans australicus]|uniref:LytR family transcriptional attenuator n=1 Tax=Frondihabitans australicus TaxID=386892 RepID=A0A495IF18_9MICO|nr:LCP family protein [Frondihabitans australicus]RKR74582.1 LytR family transcriptional attenuator [Frondihabitans australicus]
MSETTSRSRLRVRPRHVIRWIAIVVVLLLAATAAYAWYNYHQFTSTVTHIDAIPTSSTTTSSSSNDGENILLVGDDHRPADASAQELALLGTTQDGGGTNTDTMMVLHIPSNGAKASLISFPRDSWVDIPGYGMGKLNAAFAYGSEKGGDAGGAQLLVKTIQNLSGLHIDHFVRISLLGFYDVANALPDIKVCLVNAVDDSYSTFKAPAGVSTLNAQQALAFVRQRHGLPEGDLDREIRQRYFLTAEAKNFLSPGVLLNPSKLSAALKALGGAIQTDPGLNFLSLASELKDLAGGNLTSTTIPISGTPTIYYGGSYVSIVKVDTAKMPSFIASLDVKSTASSTPTATTPSVSVGGTTVTVLNGSGVSGAAATNTATLQKAGFVVTTPSTVSTRSATTIQYPASMAAQASLVANYVPGATLEAVTAVSNVTVVLGTDGDTARSTPSSGSSGSAAGSSGSSSSGFSSGSSSSGSSGSSSGSSSGAASGSSSSDSSIPCIN